ncbi:MAG: hypothetical protein M3O99_11060 [Chloroflexota bacterium]|nr:hypothetical protein [Chloroflexota bacterium]
MPRGPTDTWQAWLEAAGRKIEIAQYHFGLLNDLDYPGPYDSVQIPVQAHLEGILVCTTAATDQLARALDLSEHLGLAWNERNLSAVLEQLQASRRQLRAPALAPILDDLVGWNAEPVIEDARRLRNRASHSSYNKRVGNFEITIQRVGGDHRGSRDAKEYCHELVDHLGKLQPLLGRVERALSDAQRPAAARQ